MECFPHSLQRSKSYTYFKPHVMKSLFQEGSGKGGRKPRSWSQRVYPQTSPSRYVGKLTSWGSWITSWLSGPGHAHHLSLMFEFNREAHRQMRSPGCSMQPPPPPAPGGLIDHPWPKSSTSPRVPFARGPRSRVSLGWSLPTVSPPTGVATGPSESKRPGFQTISNPQLLS